VIVRIDKRWRLDFPIVSGCQSCQLAPNAPQNVEEASAGADKNAN
jgi:hypothetical protein